MPKNRCFTAKKVYKVSIVSDKTPFSENTISVSEVNATIKACIDAPIFKGLEVFGEISGYKFSGPHAYFTLKELATFLRVLLRAKDICSQRRRKRNRQRFAGLLRQGRQTFVASKFHNSSRTGYVVFGI